MKKIKLNLLTIIVLSLLNGCNLFSPEDKVDTDGDLLSLSIPSGFDFSTYHDVTINIEDDGNYAKYEIFAYTEDLYDAGTETFEDEFGETVTETIYKSEVMEKLLFTGVPNDGVLEQTINLPKFYDKVYIRRNENLNYFSTIEEIVDQKVNFSFNNSNSNERTLAEGDVTDYLYCVNGSGQLFQVDPLTGDLTDLSAMPMGSYTCAIDQENKVLYSIGKSKPYPLMKYSIVDNSWETVANLGMGGPRLDFNTKDGLLYFSDNSANLFVFDPATGENLDKKSILGLHNTTGGDLAFAEDGTLFICTFSGLYELELNDDGDYSSTRISADNLPFTPTSMTFDSNKELWLAEASSSADLIIMDTETGGWEYKYGARANNGTSYGRKLNDLTTFRVYSDVVDETDSDGDGIKDSDDAFPDDADAAFESFTPSKYGRGTIAFEDLWPSSGDYDFNDAALSYQAIAILNSDNLAVRLELICNIKANGAGYTNGIGFEIEGLNPSKVASVTGTVLNQGYITTNDNGTEADQENTVIILADDVDNLLNETTITISFVEPISTSELGVAPFNPFIIINKEREKEVHLPYKSITSLGNQSYVFTGDNKDIDGNFISENGYPWAISIIHDFKVPKEKVDINSAYNFFGAWAESGGTAYEDWYKDNPGNRNEDLIE
ncbi:LruC domain-containing protein [Cyclobacterium marinum]|uniref:LruC domain-containing protein n=1 Tax=Cyclobacterium marinum TaxID=104 RepID=UPI0011F0233E|nr:LruC domain-containing protein [Cyclobacterium marinum]MBI0397642.1 LruC domain-containing protein [Cyclobacterium marinum]